MWPAFPKPILRCNEPRLAVCLLCKALFVTRGQNHDCTPRIGAPTLRIVQ